jgi:hypothetical protein
LERGWKGSGENEAVRQSGARVGLRHVHNALKKKARRLVLGLLSKRAVNPVWKRKIHYKNQ